MANMKTFSPSGGQPLLNHGTVQDSFQASTNSYAWPPKDDPRPSSRSFSSFSNRPSKNTFFSRNNPHSQRVRHLKGLLDLPVCAVIEPGEEDNHDRLMVCTPTLDQMRQKPLRGLRMPINADAFVYAKEKAVPGIGMVPITRKWREELRNLVDATGVKDDVRKNPYTITNAYQMPPGSRQGLRQEEQPPPSRNGYVPPPSRGGDRMLPSRQGSRLGEQLPPPSRHGLLSPLSRAGGERGLESRLGSRQGDRLPPSRQGVPLQEERQLQHIMEFPDNEGFMMGLLGNILQTDSPQAIQSWLVNASPTEKTIMVDMIRAVVSASETAVEQTGGEIGNAAQGNKSPVYGDQLLQQESSVDMENIQKYNVTKKKEREEAEKAKAAPEDENKPKSPRPANSQQYQWTSPGCKPSSPFIAMEKKNALFLEQNRPRPGTAEAEIEDIRSRLQSRASPRVFGHQSRASAGRPVSRPHTQQSVYVPPAEALNQNAQRPPSHQSIKSQQSVLKSILLYKPEQDP